MVERLYSAISCVVLAKAEMCRIGQVRVEVSTITVQRKCDGERQEWRGQSLTCTRRTTMFEDDVRGLDRGGAHDQEAEPFVGHLSTTRFSWLAFFGLCEDEQEQAYRTPCHKRMDHVGGNF